MNSSLLSANAALRARRLGLLGLACLPVLLHGQAATTITVTPPVLVFQYQLGPAAKLPAAQTVALKSNAANLTPVVTVAGDLPSNGDWLEPSIRRGTSIKLPSSLSFTVTPTGLAAGTYGATVTLAAVDSTGTLVVQTIAVSLIVSPQQSTLHMSPAVLPAFTFITGGTTPANQLFVVSTDGSPMSVTISAASTAPWLKLNPTGTVQVGGLYQPITVSIDPIELAKLVPKQYTANITVTAPTAINKTTTYPVTLNVNAAVPVVVDTWPAGVVMNAAAGGVTTVVLDGFNFFDTSTVAATGFTSSSNVTVTDSSGTPLTATDTISIPVYSATATGMRLTLGSPLPTGFTGSAYSTDLHTFVTGGTPPYRWTATGLPGSIVLSIGGVLTSANPAAGTYSVVLSVTDSLGFEAYMPVTLTVYPTATPAAGTVWITYSAVLPAGVVGTAYPGGVTATVAGGTGPFAWTTDPTTPLPLGLTLGAAGATPAIAGTPTSVGNIGALTTKRLNDGALQVTIPNSYLAKLGVLRIAVTTPIPGGGTSNEAQLEVYGPEPRILGVGNAASYASGSVSPGEIISIFGTGLGPAALSLYDPNDNPILTALPKGAPAAGVTQVSLKAGGTTYPGALLYTSAGQVGVMVPFEIAPPLTQVQMVVTYGSPILTSKVYTLAIVAEVPGIFSADGSGKGQGAILNYVPATNDYTINSGSNPSSLSGTAIVVLYVTGFGLTNPASISNRPAGFGLAPGTVVNSAALVTVTIGGQTASVVSAVPIGSFPGVLQLNVTVPSTAAAGKAVPVTVNIGGVDAQTGITVSLK